MPSERWNRTWEVFHQAIECELHERADFVDRECAGDSELRDQVLLLLDGHERSATFLDRPEQVDPLLQRDEDLCGKRLGPYRLVRKIADGGMGVVYEAEQERPIERRVAIKLIRSGMATGDVLARFEHERRALARMDHPNIARVLDAGSVEGRPYFVMELVDGEPILTFADQRRLGTRTRLRLFVAVCRAVQHAHQKGILHRDLKPSNILVCEQDGAHVPKVIDFGIARAIDPSELAVAFTRDGQLIGTPEYMSPEQADGSDNVDSRSDIYSLGMVLYELLAGCLPASAEQLRRAALERVREILRDGEVGSPSTRLSTLGAAADEIAHRRGTEAATLRRTLAGDLDWIVLRSLAKEPDRRYPSASQFGADLERYLREEPVEARAPTFVYRATKFVRRHRVAAVAMASVFVLLTAFAVVSTLQSLQLRKALDSVEREASRADRVAEFLADLFRSSDPQLALGEQLLAREVLDQGAKRVLDELGDEPFVQGELLGLLGEVYTSLGLFDEAERMLNAATDVLTTVMAPSDPELFTITSRIGYLLMERGRTADAVELLENARSQTEWSERPELAALAQMELGNALGVAGDYQQAEELLRASVIDFENLHGREHLTTARALGQLGHVLRRRGHFDEAEVLLAEALAICERLLPTVHPELNNRRNDLANAYRETGRLNESLALMEQVRAAKEHVYGSQHPQVAGALNNLGMANEALGNAPAAEQLFRQSLNIARNTLGNEHPRTVIALNNLGTFLRRAGKLEDAERTQAEAVALSRRVHGDKHPTTGDALNNHAVTLEKLERHDGLEQLYQEVLAIRSETVGELHPSTAAAWSNLGVLYRRLGRLDEAETAYRRALDIDQTVLGADHAIVGTRLLNLAILERWRERFPQAVEYAQEAVDNQRAALGEDHPNTQRAVRSLELLERMRDGEDPASLSNRHTQGNN